MWYKLTADHGPGHQSHSDSYIESDTRLTPHQRKTVWESWALIFDNPVGDITPVRKIPEWFRESLIRQHEQQIKASTKSLKALKQQIKASTKSLKALKKCNER